MNDNARGTAGNIITASALATTAARTAAIEAAKLPAVLPLKLIPIVGTALGVVYNNLLLRRGNS